jgi:hypothetical protein
MKLRVPLQTGIEQRCSATSSLSGRTLLRVVQCSCPVPSWPGCTVLRRQTQPMDRSRSFIYCHFDPPAVWQIRSVNHASSLKQEPHKVDSEKSTKSLEQVHDGDLPTAALLSHESAGNISHCQHSRYTSSPSKTRGCVWRVSLCLWYGRQVAIWTPVVQPVSCSRLTAAIRENSHQCVKFEILTLVKLSVLFWAVRPCRLAGTNRRFE